MVYVHTNKLTLRCVDTLYARIFDLDCARFTRMHSRQHCLLPTTVSIHIVIVLTFLMYREINPWELAERQLSHSLPNFASTNVRVLLQLFSARSRTVSMFKM